MRARLVWLAGLAALLLAGGPAAADGPSDRDAQAVAKKIDQIIEKAWADAKAEPAAQADDAEFLRRVYLDLAGRIPSVAETRAFLRDTRPDRRQRLVDQILASPDYVKHFTNFWRALLIPEANNNFIVRLQQGGFEGWIKRQVARNVPYDQMARQLLTAPIAQGFGALLGGAEPSALAFYSAKEFKAENLAAGTARVFLGVSVECAQCHNHPFTDWKREQFWGMAAFYSGIQSQTFMDFLLPGREIADKKELTMPGTKKVIQARFLDGAEPKWKAGASTRTVLADWVTAPENPYFTRAAVNRTWAYFLGTGLIEPVDEMVGPEVTPSHPEVLDLLAREFAGHRYDMKFLIRVLTSTRAYQLSSASSHKSQDNAKLFARMPLRGLTAEQLFDSLAQATGYRDSGGGGNEDLRTALTGGNRSARGEFLTKFASRTERPVDAQTSILQALTLMNGKLVAAATSLKQSETLAAVVDAPFASTAERIETLYLATLSRRPSARELDRAVRFVENAARGTERTAYSDALADVFWALLNSSEFVLNH
jgi:hypothetical protein